MEPLLREEPVGGLDEFLAGPCLAIRAREGGAHTVSI